MTDDDLELVRGSGNVYRDFDCPEPDLAQACALVAGRILAFLADHAISNTEAERRTGIAHSEFSRIRHAELRRFTLDRLITILQMLDPEAEVRLIVESRADTASEKRQVA